MEVRKRFALDRLDDLVAVRAIRQGLVMAIPILLLGSFSLIFKFLPIPIYQEFLQSFLNGFFPQVFTWVNQATFGILSAFMTISISMSYARLKTPQPAYMFGAVVTSLSAYMVFNGLLSGGFTADALGVQGMFTAVVSAVGCSALFCKLSVTDKLSRKLYTVGADTDFNISLSIIAPTLIVILCAITLNQLIMQVFRVSGFNELFHTASNALFGLIDSQLIRALLFVVMSSLFWFFGIHGSNVLETVSQNLFDHNMIVNAAAVAGGGEATEIFTKTFLDCFVLMGGCGAALSLLVAILLFSRQKNVRNLGKLSAIPVLFNINETIVFGLPIVYNASLFIPFMLTPVVCFFTAYFAVAWGLVPIPMHAVEWVTPIGIGGYTATGSIAGILLQLFNLGIGVFIYRFFLLRYEEKTNRRIQQDLHSLVHIVREAEASATQLTLLELKGQEGAIAKMLTEDLKHVLKSKEGLALHYQPQYDHDDHCVGVEALLRWNHPRCGMIYPPLLVSIAQEADILTALEHAIFELASADVRQMAERRLVPPKVSVNVTALTLQQPAFADFLYGLLENNPALKGVLCVELTEQMSFMLSDTAEEKLKSIHDMGIHFAIDDFSMGHTSLKYLQSNQFDIVKLDGSLTRDVLNNPRNLDIISTIVQMSKTMRFEVIAEYVETVEQREVLFGLGCHIYQGYLYSPAVPLDKLLYGFAKEAMIARLLDTPAV